MDHYIAIQRLVHWPLMGGLLHLVQRGGDWVSWGPAQSPPRNRQTGIGNQPTHIWTRYGSLAINQHLY